MTGQPMGMPGMAGQPPMPGMAMPGMAMPGMVPGLQLISVAETEVGSGEGRGCEEPGSIGQFPKIG